MSRILPQTNYPAIKGARFDCAWTPWHGAAPLLPYLPPHSRIWECCAGAGWLAQWLEEAGHTVIATDYADGHDALEWAPGSSEYDLIVTNPPFSLKYQFIARLFALGKPWALLVPYNTPGCATAKKARDAAGKSWEELRLNTRINFHMPDSGFANSGAQMPVLWLCHGLLPDPIVEATVPAPRPEHRLLKPPKARALTLVDVRAWLDRQLPGDAPVARDAVARLILETRTRKNAIAPMTQAELFEEAA